MFENMHDATPHSSAMLATSTLHTWLLWGGLCLLFLVAYVGIYIWMRRPDFGEGKRRDRATAVTTQSTPSTPAVTTQTAPTTPAVTEPERPAARSDSSG